jgi:hypothetical protein
MGVALGQGHEEQDDPLFLWFAASAVQKDGTLRDPDEFTRTLSQWKYILRSMALIEAHKTKEIHGNLVL